MCAGFTRLYPQIVYLYASLYGDCGLVSFNRSHPHYTTGKRISINHCIRILTYSLSSSLYLIKMTIPAAIFANSFQRHRRDSGMGAVSTKLGIGVSQLCRLNTYEPFNPKCQ